jgi:hypothetical protein
MYRLGLCSCQQPQKENSTPQDIAIRTVAMRLMWYPIVQTFNRIGYTWYNIQYGPYRNFNYITTTKMICVIFISLAAVSTSVSYLCIFLLMQPTAYDHFKALIFCKDHSSSSARNFNYYVEDTIHGARIQGEQKKAMSRSGHNVEDDPHTVITTSTQPPSSTPVVVEQRESILFSFQDLRTDEELFHIIDKEFIERGVSMFTPTASVDGMSLQVFNNPILFQSPNV